ncbi:MAG: hypothetical protein WC622_16770 [Pedobacter sp.]|jgi:hypothetical protein|uniref:hypothetical protein n=1 Tax=Pedobacter sp. TaxID=1411316 RepID=UPI003569A2A4
MSLSFTLDQDAVKSESFSGGRINTTGKYIGLALRAYEKVAASGSKAIHLDYISNDGKDGSIDIWHWSAKNGGQPVDFQVKFLQTLMASLGIANLTPKENTTIEVYDYDSKGMVSKRVTSYPQLENKQFGTVWQIEEYKKQKLEGTVYVETGELGERAVCLRFFDAETGKTGKEKLEKTDAVAIDAFVDDLADVKRLKLSPQQVIKAQDAQIVNQASNSNSSFDDDSFPF